MRMGEKGIHVNWIRRSLFAKLVVSFFILSGITVGLVSSAVNIRARDALEESVFDRLQVAASLKTHQVNQWADRQRREAFTTAANHTVREQASLLLDFHTPKERKTEAEAILLREFRHILSLKTEIDNISVLTSTGIVVLSTDPVVVGEYQPLGNTSTYFESMEASERVRPNFYTSIKNRRPMITLAVPIPAPVSVSPAPRRIGVLSLDLNLNNIDEIIRERAGLGESGETYLVGNLEASIALISSSIEGESADIQVVRSEGIDSALRGLSGQGRYLNHAGIPVIGVYSWIPRQNLALIAEMEETEAFAPVKRLTQEILLLGGGSIVVLMMGVYLLTKKITQPLHAITETAIRVSGGDYDSQAPEMTEDEIGILARSFNRMIAEITGKNRELEDRVRERTRELQSTNEELEASGEELQSANEELRTTIEYLNEMRGKMIEQEKMASLGGLVAGVAHEINTPIGAALTAATYMPPLVEEFMAKMEQNALRRSDLSAFLASMDEAVQLTVNNLSRAADLVTSFKKVSADQTMDDCIEFDLSVTIHDVILSLRHEYKNRPIHVEVECPDPGILTFRNYPGAFVQILTNLIMNSLRHGLAETEDGVISITARRTEDAVLVFYSDNGCGMTEEVRTRMFDPFFTTARGVGGTGLGMSIVYNLITQRMGGTIQVQTAPGEGVLFTLRFPA